MTLTARAIPPAYHKKVTGQHHRRSKKYHKTYWPYLPLVGIVTLGFVLNNVLPGKGTVLGYATDMSIQSLLDDTNEQRSANGEASLNLNTLLDNAAQAKANDMAARNYWSHNTPDGQTPWSFMTAAGYNYQLAGENLAYGFATAADTLTGWMNSPGHRANILNAGYKDVGFGTINIANYQNSGPETLVVAMYAAPATVPTPSPITSPPKAVSSAAPSSASALSPPAATPPATNTTSPTNTTNPSAKQDDTLKPAPTQTTTVPSSTVTKVAQQAKPKTISRVQLLTAGNASWSLALVTIVGLSALAAFCLRHAFAWHKIIVKGEKFLLHHPWWDISLVAAVMLAFVLAHGSGVIR